MSRFGRSVAAIGAAAVFGLATMGPASAAEAAKSAANPPAMAQQAKPKAHKQAVANKQVKAVQEALIKDGAKLKADGVMGKQTRVALRSYQKKNGLKVSGRLDKATLQKLGIKG